MKTEGRLKLLGLALALLSLTSPSWAEEIRIPRNTVIPVVMDDTLSFRSSQEGDRFYATVDDSRELPRGTRFEGRILAIRKARGKDPAHMDVEFDTIHLPDGDSSPVRAVPLPLDSRSISRGRDDRLVAREVKPQKDKIVWGSILGGALVGTILGRKSFEGAFAGAIAGIILAETQGKQDDVALSRGAKVGALLERDLVFTFEDRDRDRDRYSNRDASLRIEAGDVRLRYEGDSVPYRSGGIVMVPLDSTARQLGLDVEYVGRLILIQDEDSILRGEQDSNLCRLNGRRLELPGNIESRGGVHYVPIEVIAAVIRESVYVDGTKVRNFALN